jgi:hypothetical protein
MKFFFSFSDSFSLSDLAKEEEEVVVIVLADGVKIVEPFINFWKCLVCCRNSCCLKERNMICETIRTNQERKIEEFYREEVHRGLF